MAAWSKGMYCFNVRSSYKLAILIDTAKGTSTTDNPDSNEAAFPVFGLPRSQWWMHHNSKVGSILFTLRHRALPQCDDYPPERGDFLELPAGGSFTVELAMNKAFTSLSYNGQYTTEWGDGQHHPEGYSSTNTGGASLNSAGCLSSPNFHTKSEGNAAGSVFAISYQSDITKVTPENLVVFTVKHHTPWKRLATYQVPTALPACPTDGCHCVWGWIPDHCGEPNMYIHPYKCTVVGATSTVPLAKARPPKWCDGDQKRCITGAKQMIFWAQKDGNNVELQGDQADGQTKSPGYNMKMGFHNGAQNDIFMESDDKDRLLRHKVYARLSRSTQKHVHM
ncbi:SubName: Full=Uncharacterized protein {ECO:0000313/EMBL:CCA72555.1} [Serendipita indica DSM 11827]|nr:SubName: Full=Uncharacterized protein {ECO:0000313/EMBL:CCA72555.1} [Serendipita indica DSM 11827]